MEVATLNFPSAMSNPEINEVETKIEGSFFECTGVLVGENGERLPLMGVQRRERM